jgi:Protein of unknown function (DUF3011)
VRKTSAAGGCLVAALMFALPVHARADQTITCESRNYRHTFCRVDTDRNVTLTRQRSSTRCRLWDNWGYDNRGVWVDRGCAADFHVGKSNTGRNAAIAGAAIAGIAIAAAIAANKDHHDDGVPSWAVGEFRGFDDRDRTDVTVTIFPGGNAEGDAGGSRFTGRWDKGRLSLGEYRFRADKSGNGFMATDERDGSHRVYFRRVGGGY